MKNIKKVIFLSLILFGFLINPFTFNYSRSVSTKDISTNSLHMNISGTKFWVCIRADSPSPNNITLHRILSIDGNNSSLNFDFVLANYNNSYFYVLGGFFPGVNPDYYIQAHAGRINWSYFHKNDDFGFWRHGNESLSFSAGSGTYFFTIVSYAKICIEEIWLTSTQNATFSITQGTDVFAFDRHDFVGKINIGTPRGTYILKGEKTILINDSFFWTQILKKTGFERFNYNSTSGIKGWKYSIDKKGEPIRENQSEDFDKRLWWAPKGKWTFSIDMVNFGRKSNLPPNVYILGADIKRPQKMQSL